MNPHLGDDGIFDFQPQPSHGMEFAKGFAFAFGGAILGSMLDHTRFGRWFNTSKFIGFLGKMLKVAVLSAIGLYVYFVIKVW